MKRKFPFFLILLLTFGLISCTASGGISESEEVALLATDEVSAEDQVATVLAKTAALEEAVYGTMTALAPIPTSTLTPSITPTSTETVTLTPSPTIIPTAAPTQADPNIEPWCNDHDGCEKAEIRNNTNFWVNIRLQNRDTGTDTSYSVPPRGHAWLTIRPGYFHYVFTLCGGQVVQEGYHGLNMHWYIQFRESVCEKYE